MKQFLSIITMMSLLIMANVSMPSHADTYATNPQSHTSDNRADHNNNFNNNQQNKNNSSNNKNYQNRRTLANHSSGYFPLGSDIRDARPRTSNNSR